MIDTIHVDDKVYNEDKSLVLIKGIENPKLKGCIFNAVTHEMIAASFMDVETVEYDKDTFKNYFKEGNTNNLSICYEGPLVIVRFDKEGKKHFYNTKRHDCTGSFWGNKQEKFGDLFMKYGGEKFINTVEKIPSISHHFMIMSPSLLNTTRIDFRNNEGLVVYLGSVSIDGTILNPQNFSPDVYYYHKITNNNFLPSKEEIKGKVLIPSRLTEEGAIQLLENGYHPYQSSGKIEKEKFSGECVILRINSRKIIKFVPKCYKLRSFVVGNVPNVKNRLYAILEMAKDKEKYDDNFPIVGSLEKECIEALRIQKPIHEISKNMEMFLERYDNYVDSRITDRMNNIFLTCILCCPLTKIPDYIDSWYSYLTIKDNITKFIKEKNAKIREGLFDEKLSVFHQKALNRIKDIANVSKEYATTEKNGYPYIAKLEYSIKGLVRNEFGPSLYRIEKALNFLKQENTEESVSSQMEL